MRPVYAVAVVVILALVGYGLAGVALAAHADATTPPCRIFVHRANMQNVDEEQPAGIKRAGKFGGAEIDVRLTKDGWPVSVHDSGLGRITDGKDKRKVIDLTLAQVRAVTLTHGGHPRPFAYLAKVAADNGVPLVVELKPVPPGSATRWVSADDGPTGFDRLSDAVEASGVTVIWNTGRPDIFANLAADDRFNGRLLVRPNVYGPDPSTLDGALFGSFNATQLTQERVDMITSHGARPFMTTPGTQVAEARGMGVRNFQTHYPSKVKEACS